MRVFFAFLKAFIVCVLLGLSAYTWAAVDIVVNQNDSPDPVPSGGQLTYSINVANNGPDDATGVKITDVLPSGTTLVSVTTAQGSCTGTTTISCNIGNINNNDSVNVVIVVSAPVTAGTISNTVSSTRNETDTNSANNNDTDTTTVTVSANLKLSKTDSADPVNQGQAYSYALAIQNLGPQAHTATDVITVTDNIPLSMRLTALPSGTGWTCSSSGGATFPQNGPVAVTCTRSNNSIALNASLPTITVPVLALSSGSLVNQASVSSTMPDNSTGNNTATQGTTINSAADLTIGKNTTASPLGASQTYTYTLTPQLVVGSTAGASVTVTDPLPTGIVVTSAATVSGSSGTWSCQYSPAQTLPFTVSAANAVTLSCTSSSIYSNSALTTATLATIAFNYQPQVAGTLVNTTSIALSGLPDPVSGNNTTSVSRTVNSSSDLRVIKTSSGTDAKTVGTAFSYTLAYRNIGPASVPTGTTVTLTDILPAGLTVTSLTAPAGWTCPATPIVGPSTIVCTRDGLAVSGSDANIVFNTTATAAGTRVNTASISSPLTDPDSTNNQSSKTIDVFAPTGGVGATYNDLSIAKEDTTAGAGYGPDPVGLSGLVKYRLRITNRGPDNIATGRVVTVTDTLPFNATGVSVTPVTATQGWSCSLNGATMTCSRTVNASNNALRWLSSTSNDIDVVLRADSGTSMTNAAQVATTNDPVSNNNTAQESTSILSDANLKLTKTVSVAQVLFGQNYSYSFKVENLGSNPVPAGAANAIRLLDDMRPNPDADYVSSSGTGWVCTTAGTGGADPLTCDYSAGLAVGASTTLVVTVKPRTTGLARSNSASISFVPTALVADPDFADNSSTVNVDVLPAADLQVSKTASLTSVAVGQDLSYIMTVRNVGPSASNNAKLIDTLPSGMQVRSVSATGGGVCQLNTPAVGQVQCVWSSLGVNVSQAVTLVVRPLNAVAGQTLTNTVVVSGSEADPLSSNNTSSVDVNVTAAKVDLLVNKIDLQDPVAQNGVVTYQVTVRNLGPSVATNVVLTEQLPSTYLSFINATSTQGSCAAPNAQQVMLCQLDAIEAGASVVVTVSMAANSIGTDTNTVSVTSDEVDTNSANNNVSENTTVQLGTDAVISKTASVAQVIVGQPFSYKLSVLNVGPANSSLTATDSLPTGISYVSATPSRGTCQFVAPTLTCSLGVFAAGQSASVDVTVIPTAPSTLTNVAVVSGTAPELLPANNQSAVDVDSRIRVAGKVFVDNSGTTATASAAYNGVQDAGEVGLSAVDMQLTDCDGVLVQRTQSNAAGEYEFLLSQVLPNPDFCVIETNPNGYQSVSGRGTTYVPAQDRHQIFTTSGISYSALDFGDARLQLVLTSDGQQTTNAGGTVSYGHTLTAQSVVTPTLLRSTSQQPNLAADQVWEVVLYRDDNCNAIVDSGEPVLPTLPQLLPDQTICIVQRVNAPSSASAGAQHVAELTASYQALVQGGRVMTGQGEAHRDITTIGGTGRLDMQKRVRKVASCPSSISDNQPFVLRNQAASGDYLEYDIMFTNNANRAVSSLVLKDETPTGTVFKHAYCHDSTAGLGCGVSMSPSVNTQGALRWSVAGPIAPSQSGRVRFCVQAQ